MAASLPISYLNEVKPYKTGWRVEVKVLHAWKQYTKMTGETLEMILADEKGVKIHASVKKDHVIRVEGNLREGEWRSIENFGLSHATGKFRPTNHAYKMGFLAMTVVTRCPSRPENNYLSLVSFQSVLTPEKLNPNILVDIVGHVNVGQMESLEVNNKPTKKLEFELRDDNDERLGCTLWGSFAEQVYQASEDAGDEMVICLIRFAKIKEFRGFKYISNAFEASQVMINPQDPEIVNFKKSLPEDGLALTILESKPKCLYVPKSNENWNRFPRKTIAELLESTEVGKARVMCTIFAIDTDWAWYYFGCRKCNKIVRKPRTKQVLGKTQKPKFWCDHCKASVTNVDARYKLHVKVMDQTSETKCMLFGQLAEEIIAQPVSDLLDGSFDEIEDPSNVPDAINNLIGKTYQFGVCVEKENLDDGHNTFKVAKVLSNKEMEEDQIDHSAEKEITPSEIISGDQVTLMLTNGLENSESGMSSFTTPSSKRKEEENIDPDDQASTTKKLCIKSIKLENIKVEKNKDNKAKDEKTNVGMTTDEKEKM